MTRIILDEGVPKTLARRLRERGLDATAFPNEWKQLTNGALLSEIERRGFDVLITNDKRMQYQQSVKDRRIAVLVLPTNLRPKVIELIPALVLAIQSLKAGSFASLDSAGELRR